VYAIALLICLLVTMFLNLHLQYFMLLMPVPVWAGTIFSLIKGTFSQLFKGQLRFD
jgi:Na+/glutamate symporter